MATIDLEAPCTQADFGALVGISQQAVSDLMGRDILKPDGTPAQWLLAYCAHLREQAAGRGADGELAFQRAEQARVARERNEIALARDRRIYASVALIELVLAMVSRSIVGVLEPLSGTLHKQCPALTPADVKLIQSEIARACDAAAAASLAILDNDDEPDDALSADNTEAGEAEGLEL